MKYIVHTWQANRYSYAVEAESAEAAQKLVSEDGWKMEPVATYTGDPEWSPNYVVDPILPNGEVDYENVLNVNEEVDGL